MFIYTVLYSGLQSSPYPPTLSSQIRQTSRYANCVQFSPNDSPLLTAVVKAALVNGSLVSRSDARYREENLMIQSSFT